MLVPQKVGQQLVFFFLYHSVQSNSARGQLAVKGAVFWTSYKHLGPMSIFTAVMKGCCLECPGWVPVILLQFTCLSFLMTYLYEALIINFLCRHASSSEASLYHFRADCGWVMMSVSCTCAHTTHTHQHTSLLTCSLTEHRRGEKHPLQCVLQILCPELALCCSLQSCKMCLGMSLCSPLCWVCS